MQVRGGNRRLTLLTVNGHPDDETVSAGGAMARYAAEGLRAVVDLGRWWKGEHGLPLPLGVNAIRKDLPPDVQHRASRALKASIVYGLDHRSEALGHAMQFARDMETSVADRFVGMYVNDWTVDLGSDGKRSIELFLRLGAERNLIPGGERVEFID